jgi:ElaB/YqjD/DUF883 family membrane-anchored ribosome-binding protein
MGGLEYFGPSNAFARVVMKLLAAISLSLLLTDGMVSLFAQTAKDDMKDAKEDVKQAGKATGRAAKHTGRAVKKTSKKAVNKTAEKTEEGADAVRRKTNP